MRAGHEPWWTVASVDVVEEEHRLGLLVAAGLDRSRPIHVQRLLRRGADGVAHHRAERNRSSAESSVTALTTSGATHSAATPPPSTCASLIHTVPART